MAHSITTTWKKPVIEHFHWLSSEGVSGGVTGGVCNISFSLAHVGGVSNQLFFRLKKKSGQMRNMLEISSCGEKTVPMAQINVSI